MWLNDLHTGFHGAMEIPGSIPGRMNVNTLVYIVLVCVVHYNHFWRQAVPRALLCSDIEG